MIKYTYQNLYVNNMGFEDCWEKEYINANAIQIVIA